MFIGNHLTASKGFAAMGKMAMALGGNTFAFFTRNPRGGKAKEIDRRTPKNLCISSPRRILEGWLHTRPTR